MECSEARARLVRYADDDLSALTHEEVEAHLDHCYLCLEELNETVALLDACKAALHHPYPRNGFEQLLPHMGAHVPAPDTHVFRPRAVVRRTAAAAAILIISLSVGDHTFRITRHLMGLMNRAATATESDLALSESGAESMPLVLAWQHRILRARALSEGTHRAPQAPANTEAPAIEEAESDGALQPISSRPDGHRQPRGIC